MNLFYVERVRIEAMNANGTFRAVSKTGSMFYDKCYFVGENPSNVCQEQLGRSALMVSIDNQNFILGYYVDDHEMSEYKLYVEGEQLLRAGESKAISLGDDGTIGIYDITRNSDGTITKLPKFEYGADEKTYMAFRELLATMTDSSVSVEVSQNDLGYNKLRFIFKGRGDDAGERYSHEISSSPMGVQISTEIDISPTPKRVVPQAGASLMPGGMGIKIGYGSSMPLELLFTLSAIPNTMIKISKDGRLTFNTGPAGSMSSIELDPIGNDSVVIKNNVAGTGKITISKTGAIVIDGMAGAEIKGVGTGLVQTLISFMSDYMAHVHASAMGPTMPPTPPSGAKTLVNLRKIKGSAK